MNAMLDLWTLYNWDNTVLDNLQLPAAVPRDAFIPNLLMECAELEVRYADPAFMKQAVGWWSARRLPIWQKLAETLDYEYDPIYNFDRKEEWKEVIDRDRTNQVDNTHSDTETIDGTESGTTSNQNKHNDNSGTDVTGESTENTTSSSTTDNELSRTAFNTDDMKAAEATAGSERGTGKVSTDGEQHTTFDTSGGSTDNGSHSNTTSTDRDTSGKFSEDTQEAEDTTHTHQGRMYGNIGVTTTQQLIEAQREVVQFDLGKYIIDDFQQEFCLLVY